MIKHYFAILSGLLLLSACHRSDQVEPESTLFTQQGNKIISNDVTGISPNFGSSVGISADGNVAIVASPGNNWGEGAAYIFQRTGNIWTQQGGALVCKSVNNPFGDSLRPYAVALSADGNTAVIGDGDDDMYRGATWVFTRSGDNWTQMGDKLVGTGAVAKTTDPSYIGASRQGASVAISADGNTIIVGGQFDYDPVSDRNPGAVWIFVRSGNTWIQQGEKLVGTGDYFQYGYQGKAVALSADGNTAVVGGDFADGATWVFTRSGGTWSQQGEKIIGTGAITDRFYGGVHQGSSVAISSDGNTIVVGGDGDNLGVGAVWVFKRSAGTWTQQGKKLVSQDALPGVNGGARQGSSVAIDGDGNTIVVGAPNDNNGIGACWVYTRAGILWKPLGSKIIGSGGIPIPQTSEGIRQGTAIALSTDGKTFIIGGNLDDNFKGAAWIFNRK